MKKYKVLFCPKCHKAQMTSARERLKCISCSKTSKLESGFLFQTDDPATASWAVRKVTKEFNEGMVSLNSLFKILEKKENNKEAYKRD